MNKILDWCPTIDKKYHFVAQHLSTSEAHYLMGKMVRYHSAIGVTWPNGYAGIR